MDNIPKVNKTWADKTMWVFLPAARFFFTDSTTIVPNQVANELTTTWKWAVVASKDHWMGDGAYLGLF